MTNYSSTDGYGDAVTIEAETPLAAAQEYVSGGNWDDITRTVWFMICVTVLDADGAPVGEGEWLDVSLDPPEPPCAEGHGHEWESPFSVLGGVRENPGVQGHGGGVVITTVCRHCGKYQVVDTWAQDDSGRQGLTETSYRDADEASLAWIQRLTAQEAR